MKARWVMAASLVLIGAACGGSGGSGGNGGAGSNGNGTGTSTTTGTSAGPSGSSNASGGGAMTTTTTTTTTTSGGGMGGIPTTTVTVGSSSGGPPSSVAVTGTIDQNPDPVSTVSSDQTTLYTIYTGSVSSYTVTPSVSDQLDLSKASSSMLESPSLGGCKSMPSISLGIGNASIQFAGSDTLPATDCLDFAKAIKSSGIQMHYKDVPFLNGGSVADVDVHFTP